MLANYRATLALPGARTLTIVCALAWLTSSVYGLGVVLAIQEATGSFATAGTVAGAFALGTALLAPLRGRLVDRRGPRLLLPLASLHAALVIGLLVAGAAPAAVLGVLAFLCGATVPPLIAVARTRWAQLAGSAEAARPAHALNAVLADVAAVAGPALVAGLALTVGAAPAIAVFLPGTLVAAIVLGRPSTATAAAPATRPRPEVPAGAGAVHDGSARRARRPRGIPGGAAFQLIVAIEGLLAVAFGAFDVIAPGVGADAGAPALGATALAGFAAGSAAAGFWSGAADAVAPPARRLVTGLAVTTIAFAAASLTPTVLSVALAAVPAGAGVGLAFVAILQLIDDMVPEERAVEAFTWLTAGGGLGAAGGTVVAGHLIADGQARAALLVCVAAVLLSAACGVVAVRRRPALHHHASRDQREAATSSSVG